MYARSLLLSLLALTGCDMESLELNPIEAGAVGEVEADLDDAPRLDVAPERLQGGDAWFEGADGARYDLTDAFAAGTPEAPAEIAIDRDGVLRLAGGTFYARVQAIDSAVEIRGVGREATVLSAAKSGSALRAQRADLQLVDLTVADGRAEFGGGVAVSEGSLALQGVALVQNRALEGGGAVALDRAVLVASDVTLQDNRALYGGGLFVGQSQVTLERADLSGNEALAGGGLYVDAESDLEIWQGVVTGNAADAGGGLFVDTASRAVLVGVQLTENTAEDGAGAFVDDQSALEIDGSPEGAPMMNGNRAARDGGALFLSHNSSASIRGAWIADNSAARGGGVYLEDASALDVDMTGFDANAPEDVWSADVRGGFTLEGAGAFGCDVSGCF